MFTTIVKASTAPATVYSNTSTVVVSGGGGGGGISSIGNITMPTSWYGATGSSGMVLSSSGSFSSTSINADVRISGPNPTISTDDHQININDLINIIEMMKEVFCIIPKNQTLLDSNPTLKDSYEQYEAILKQKLSDPALLEAYNEYKTLEILSKEENK
jgi:hypothetical protein